MKKSRKVQTAPYFREYHFTARRCTRETRVDEEVPLTTLNQVVPINICETADKPAGAAMARWWTNQDNFDGYEYKPQTEHDEAAISTSTCKPVARAT